MSERRTFREQKEESPVSCRQMSHSHQYKDPLPSHYIHELLEISDFVKFAKVKPTTDENVKAYNNAFSFVEETKPVIENEDEALNVKSSQQTKKNRNNKKTKRTK